MKNKANVNIDKIVISSFMTSKYEDLWAFLCFFAAKNKANPPSADKFSIWYRISGIAYILAVGTDYRLK